MTSSAPTRKKLFLVGPGLIGSSLLISLLKTRPDLHLSALTRRQAQADELKHLGIIPVLGSLDDHDIIAAHSGQSEIIIHAASADDQVGTKAIVDGIKARTNKSKKVIYIQTSGTDELIDSGRNVTSEAERYLSDQWTDEQIEARLPSNAWHRNVDGYLRRELFNTAAEQEHNVITAIMMPPLIYGVGSPPFNRLSIQTPMLARAMINGKTPFTLPDGHAASWGAVWVHDLVRAYEFVLAHLETLSPGQFDHYRKSHYVFPGEPKLIRWKDLLDAVVEQLQLSSHPAITNKEVKLVQSKEEFEELTQAEAGPYLPALSSLFYGHEHHSFTKADYLSKLGFKHIAQEGSVITSIKQGELDTVIKG
ncbi:unnamed protein product [Sympodiomycopsis kandeliae]